MLWWAFSRWTVSYIELSLSLVSVFYITCGHSFLFPFLSTTSPSTSVEVAICILLEELTPKWDKHLLGDPMATNVSNMLESCNTWHCMFYVFYFPDTSTNSVQDNVSGLSAEPATLSIVCVRLVMYW